MSEEESSVLFSLKELMTIEEDRIEQEQEDKERVETEAETARLAAEAAARDAEQARRVAEEERRRQDEQQQKENAARLSAIQTAEVEKSRAETEQKARMEAMAAQQSHERQLTALQQDKGKTRLRNMLIGAGAFVIIAGGLTGFFIYKRSEENAAAIAVKEREAQRLKEDAEKKTKELEAKLSEIKELEDKMSKAADPAEIERLRKQLADRKSEAGSIRTRGGPRPGGKAGPAPKKKCAKGDPLCSDI
jgi:colicin import membrane protein